MEFEQVKSPRLGVYVVKLTLKVSVFIFSHRQGHRHPSLEKVVFFFLLLLFGTAINVETRGAHEKGDRKNVRAR